MIPNLEKMYPEQTNYIAEMEEYLNDLRKGAKSEN